MNVNGNEIKPYANLEDANLYCANLEGANLNGADLRGANLRVANLKGADLRGADLRGADLYGANLQDADLRGADLYGADLEGANLQCAKLQCAKLYGANLRGAKLEGADVTGTILEKKKEESQDTTSLSQKVKELEEEIKKLKDGFRAGADQELEACCEYIAGPGKWFAAPWEAAFATEQFRLAELRRARRPKPPSLAEEALAALNEIEDRYAGPSTQEILVRRALERLQELENND